MILKFSLCILVTAMSIFSYASDRKLQCIEKVANSLLSPSSIEVVATEEVHKVSSYLSLVIKKNENDKLIKKIDKILGVTKLLNDNIAIANVRINEITGGDNIDDILPYLKELENEHSKGKVTRREIDIKKAHLQPYLDLIAKSNSQLAKLVLPRIITKSKLEKNNAKIKEMESTFIQGIKVIYNSHNANGVSVRSTSNCTFYLDGKKESLTLNF